LRLSLSFTIIGNQQTGTTLSPYDHPNFSGLKSPSFAMPPTDPPPDSRSGRRSDAEESPIEAATLLQGRQQVLIRHDGEVYRLVLTRNNKLLLQK
jgi:hemin uptake protein HemP